MAYPEIAVALGWKLTSMIGMIAPLCCIGHFGPPVGNV
jgi:hypothetical protein